MILDYRCFLKDNLLISLPKLNCNEKEEFNLDTNFSVRFFMQLAVTQQELNKQNVETDKIVQLLKNIAVEILNLDESKNITLQYINDYFDDFHLLKSLYNIVLRYSNNLFNDDLYKLPDIKVNRKGVSDSYMHLVNTNNVEYMESITLVMQQTANSFNDVMKMPYSCFLQTVKQIRLNNLLQDEEWRKEYIKWKYKVEYKNGNIEEKQTPDLVGLRSFISSQ